MAQVLVSLVYICAPILHMHVFQNFGNNHMFTDNIHKKYMLKSFFGQNLKKNVMFMELLTQEVRKYKF